jgi:hypothetical protein
MLFDTGFGLALGGSTAWTLDIRVTSPGDDSWLSTYDYGIGGGRWVLRDASVEPAFADAMGAALTGWSAVRNGVDEVVGMRLSFEVHDVSLILHGGEITT